MHAYLLNYSTVYEMKYIFVKILLAGSLNLHEYVYNTLKLQNKVLEKHKVTKKKEKT